MRKEASVSHGGEAHSKWALLELLRDDECPGPAGLPTATWLCDLHRCIELKEHETSADFDNRQSTLLRGRRTLVWR